MDAMDNTTANESDVLDNFTESSVISEEATEVTESMFRQRVTKLAALNSHEPKNRDVTEANSSTETTNSSSNQCKEDSNFTEYKSSTTIGDTSVSKGTIHNAKDLVEVATAKSKTSGAPKKSRGTKFQGI